jgi:hypothetical protein
LLFGTFFDKMFLSLNRINVEKFRTAESYAELTKSLFDFKEAQDIFVKSPLFMRQGLNGKTI